MLEIVRKEVLKYDQEVVEPREKLLFEKAVEEKTRMVYDELGAAEADETVEDNVVKSLPNDEAGGEDGVGENHQPAAVPRADGGSLVPDKAGHNHDEHEVEYAADQEEEDGAEGVEDQGEDMGDEEPGEVNCQQFALDTPRAIVSVSNS